MKETHLLCNHTKINYWTDLWFDEYKKSGYIAVTSNLKKYSFYGSNQIESLINYNENQLSRYISVNAFDVDWEDIHHSRSTFHLKQIRNIAIDIDQYTKGQTINQTLDEIQSLILDKILPEPNLVLISHGIQLVYSIHQGASPEMGWLVGYITEQFIEKLLYLGADTQAKDLARLIRFPKSINQKNGEFVRTEIWYDEPYTLRELQAYCRPLTKYRSPRKKQGRILGNFDERLTAFYKINYYRLEDLRKLAIIRNGNFTYCRNTYIYILAYHQSLMVNSQSTVFEIIWNDVKGIYTEDKSKSVEKLTKSWVKKTVKSAYNDARDFFESFVANGYRIVFKTKDGIIKPYKTENLIKKLHITTEEQRKLRTLINCDIARERDTERKRLERRKKGMKSMEEYNKLRQINKDNMKNKIEGLLKENPNITNKEIAGKLGVSTKTVQRYKKEIIGGHHVSV